MGWSKMGFHGDRRYMSMREVTFNDYLDYIKDHNKILIEGSELEIGIKQRFERYGPESFKLEETTVWSFPERGDWATHRGDYRGNWPPQLARNIILRYSRPGELVLDQMCGGGTTLVECKLLQRKAIGVDINLEALMLCWDRLNFHIDVGESEQKVEIKLYQGDARNLNLIESERVDLIATHPPYAGIIKYSKSRSSDGDLSKEPIEDFLESMREIARESFRVLRPGRYCAILIGDTRRHRHYVPLAFRVMQCFLDAGFILREDIIKHQWKVKKSGEKWKGLAKTAEECWVDKPANKRFWTDFLLIYHEHLFVFRKPKKGEKLEGFIYSMKWW
ncbi:MAG: DNA methyltransferase [Candidatus Methanomethyliaceae archaeon]|nr:DNA methyltransferase [Candidatus Methanomethyliaceae archaeon]